MVIVELWPHQQRGLTDIWSRVDSGSQRIVLTAPTGAGKTLLSQELIREAQRRGWPVSFYTHRKWLASQTSDCFRRDGINHGLRASGYQPALLKDIQISMIQTEEARVFKNDRWTLHDAKLVIVDECHANKSETVQKILNAHVEAGAHVIGLTATPLDIGNIYSDLVVAGVNSELREVGAHVPCITYGPDEPDMRGIAKNAAGEYTYNDVKKRIMVQSIFGRVFDHWKRLNPDGRATILFAPGVPESKWFVDQFESRGVTAASIDGDNIYTKGKEYPSTQEARDDILEQSRLGEIKVICNRYVMREGVDAPWLYHCIFATVFGSLTGYLQSGGRIIRSHPSLGHVILQDHGGNWWRHGSLNEDREWDLSYTNLSVAREKKEKQQNDQEPEPIMCPNCSGLRMAGPKCPFCGHVHKRSHRIVIQQNGDLKELTGRVHKKKKSPTNPYQQAWDKVFYSSRNSKSARASNFQQAKWRFETSNPSLRIVTMSEAGKQITAVRDSSGSCYPLERVPYPDSPTWNEKCRDAEWKSLQRGKQ